MRPHLSRLWKHPEFVKFWIGKAVSDFGSQITLLALPLTATLVLRASPVQMGLLTAIQSLPDLLVGLFAGVWVDRTSRTRLALIASDLGRGALLASVPVAYLFGTLHFEQLYIVGFLVGVLNTFSGVAYYPFLLSIVARDQLLEATSKLSLSGSAAGIAGPGLAGTLVQLLTAPIAILMDALSFLLSALFLALLRTRESELPKAGYHVSVPREIADGLRFVGTNGLLRALAGNNATWGFFDNLALAVLVLYATRELGLGPGLLGLAFVGAPVGLLLGNLLVEKATRLLGFGRAAVWAAVVGSMGGILYALVGGPIWFAAAGLAAAEFLMGLGGAVYDITTRSLRQAITPDPLLGRMNASFNFLSGGVAPLGALAGGFLGQAIGLRATLVVGAIGGVTGFLWVWFSPLRTLKQPPQAMESAASPGRFISPDAEAD